MGSSVRVTSLSRDTVFEQGETRDFLAFLRKIKYDHRQCPGEDEDESVMVHVSVVNPRKQSISHRSLLRLQDNGVILYSRRISVVAECPMDLTLFPFDSQVCKLGIESYGYTAEKVQYKWSQGLRKALKLHKIRLPDFQIKEAFVTSHMEPYATGNYSRLYICFVFSRSAGFCFLQLIIPSTAVVITSWVSLWMENETSFQDMISIILTITFLLFSYNEVMPRVSYIKAMDVYLGVCFMIVFLSLIKLSIVKYMRQRLRMTRDTSIVAGMMPMLRLAANGIPLSPKTPPLPLITTPLSMSRTSTNSINIPGAFQLPPTPKNSVLEKEHGCWKKFNDLFNFEFSAQFMRRFHWMSQMTFFFGFVLFCLFYFLVYPNIHTTAIDPACIREQADWFAEIH
uniref:Uncharacterized protein n=1 Tax=Panagrolaimus sp. PS1159 TaxID=55785 RepID=A0AC35FQ08_9BILA